MDQKVFLENTVNALLENENHFLVEVKHSKGPNDKFTVVVDGDNGISIDDCSKLSRKIGNILEETKGFGENFTLDVTSPGVGKPLMMLRQYKKNTGRNVKVKTDEKTYQGRLEQVTEQEIVLLEKPEKKKKESRIKIPFESIKSTIVEVSFK